MRHRPRLVALVFALAFSAGIPLYARQNSLPPCFEREQFRDNPWTDGSRWCQEEVINDPTGGPLAFSALEVGNDGTLYATRPLAGEIIALTDSDGDALPDEPAVLISGLTLPNGLAFHEGDLYVSGGRNLYRVREGEVETLIDDLPWSEAGFWTGGVAVGPDERLYVAVGAPCDACNPGNPAQGAVLSFELDGTDRTLVATGLRHPADIAFLHGRGWTLDTAPENAPGDQTLDELNAFMVDKSGVDFGWPACSAEMAECLTTQAPALTFPRHSNPVSIAAYTSNTFPSLTDSLLIVLSGSHNRAMMQGYALVAASVNADGTVDEYRPIIPNSPNPEDDFTVQEMNLRYSGFWPRHPLGVAVSPEGWVYVSVADGRILALRP